MREILDLFREGQKIIVYGAGLRGNVIVKTLKDFNVECIAIVDRDPDKIGNELQGIKVYGLEYFKTSPMDALTLVSIKNCESICESLKDTVPNLMSSKMGDYVIRLSYLDCESYGYESIEDISHYMSPYPAIDTVSKYTDMVSDIDFNIDVQKAWFQKFVSLYREIQGKNLSKNVKPRYYQHNTKYGIVDALTLHGMILNLKPHKIIEVGSGFSSAVMLDTNEYCLEGTMDLEFVEPFPERLNSLLHDNDKITIHKSYLQDVDRIIFKQLKAGDILFIDSSHMSKAGSDVNEIIFEILPELPSGVYIHFHDVMKNFDYPTEWLKQGWIWNESYLLRAFLMNNKDYEIVFFCDMWNKEFEYTNLFDDFVGGANLWIKKK